MWPFDGKTRKRVLVRFKLSETGQRDADRKGYCDNPLQYRVVRIPWRYDHLIMDYDGLPYVPFCATPFNAFPTTEAILDEIGSRHGYRGGQLDVSERLVARATVDVHGSYAHGKGYRPNRDGWYWYESVNGAENPVMVKKGKVFILYLYSENDEKVEMISFDLKETRDKQWHGELVGKPSQMTIKKGA